MKTIGSLRRNFDGSEPFMTGGHQIKSTAGATQHARRLRRIPVWALDDEQIKQILLRSFPKLQTDATQRIRAGRWASIINYYFKVGWTQGRIAEELHLSDSTVNSAIRNIKRAAEGRNTETNEPLHGKRGRPKKLKHDKHL